MRRSASNVAAIGFGAFALIIGLALAYRYYEPPPPPAGAPIAAAPLFAHTFDNADGQPQALTQWQGALLVVNFWATWCAPCIEEMPDFAKVQSEYAHRGVTVIGLAIDNAGDVRRFRDELKLELPLLIAGPAGSELARQLGNPSGALPYTVLIDPSGQVVRAKLGRLHAKELRSWLDERLS